MRISKKERKENALKWYNIFMNSNCNKSAIVVKRTDSSNPNICRCQFLTVPSTLAFMENPIVIAESTMGIQGCFMELLGSIKSVPQKTYYEDGFNEWILNAYGFEITYKDGLVFMLERNDEEVEDDDILPENDKNMFDRFEKFDFRDQKITFDYNWLDDDTFIFQFGDDQLTDSDGLEYFIHFEYHLADDEWIVEIFWDDDATEVIGFDGSDEYITEQEIEQVKEFAKQFME